MNYVAYPVVDEQWAKDFDRFIGRLLRLMSSDRTACTYEAHFQFEPPASRLRSLPAWNAVHQRKANVTQPLLPAERPW